MWRILNTRVLAGRMCHFGSAGSRGVAFYIPHKPYQGVVESGSYCNSIDWTGPFWQCPVVLYPYFG